MCTTTGKAMQRVQKLYKDKKTPHRGILNEIDRDEIHRDMDV